MTDNLKRTRWFPPEVKPAIPGLYESKGSPYLWLWNGKVWRNQNDHRTAFNQERTWRGLTKDPSAASPSSANQGAEK